MNNKNRSPVAVNNNPLIVDKPSEAKCYPSEEQTENDEEKLYVTYKPYFQGVIAQDQLENETPFYDMRSALVNAFLNDNYGLIVLDGYTLAIIKTSDHFYIFDSHQRNCYGMPDPNGVAVVIKCFDINELQEYLCSLSFELNVKFFELVPVHFENNCANIQFDETSPNAKVQTKNFESITNHEKNRTDSFESTMQTYSQKANDHNDDHLNLQQTETRLARKRACYHKRKAKETENERRERLDRNAAC